MPALVSVARQRYASSSATPLETTTTVGTTDGSSRKSSGWPNNNYDDDYNYDDYDDNLPRSLSTSATVRAADDNTRPKERMEEERENDEKDYEEDKEEDPPLTESMININKRASEDASESAAITTAPKLERKLSKKIVHAQHVRGWEWAPSERTTVEKGDRVSRPSKRPRDDNSSRGWRSVGHRRVAVAAARGSTIESGAGGKDGPRRRGVEARGAEDGVKAFTPRRNDVEVAVKRTATGEGSDNWKGRGDRMTREIAGGRRVGEREEGSEEESEQRGDGDRGVSEDNGTDVSDTQGCWDESNHGQMQPGGFDWVPQSRLDTSQILSGSRRRSSKPELFTYKEMPRNYVRGSTKSRTTENTNIGESGDDDGHGANGASCGSGGTSSSSPRSDVKNKKRKQRKDKNENGRNADMGQGTGERYGKKRSSKEIVGDSPRRTKAAAAVAETLRGEHGRLVGSAAMTSNPSSSISLLRTAGGDRYRDTDADTDITGTATDVELDAAETISTCSTSSKFPLGSVIDSSRISISARRKSSPRPYRWSSRRTGERSPVMLTYVTHEQPDASEDDTEANLSPGGREAAGGNGANATPSTLRRYKRRRPLVLPGGSARAVVWSDPCPVCRGEGPTSAVKEGDALATSSVSNGTPHASFLRGVGGGGQGDGPARPGQYVYLRNAASEDVRRSLISEGEFAAPRSGGLFDGALAGERIRVWRNHGVDGGIRTFAEADVVQFNSTSGKHRVRFVHDGAVEDVKLTKAEAEHGSCTGEDQERSGSGEVRWLQRRTRLRNRDTVRRNAAGLCEGPGGEMRGLVGDEHDPVAQRRENWRWAMSRWRWECGERDGYSTGGRQEEGSGISGVVSKVRDARSFEERSGVPPAGDGMFPPIGKVLAVERRLASTGEKREGPDAVGLVDRVGNGGDGSATETFLKVARLWYPQDTWSGMDPFVHGKAEVFEACRVVRGSGVDGAEKRKTAQDRGVGVECVCGPRASCSCGSTSPFNRKLTPVVLANDYADTGGVRTTAMSYVPVGCSRLDSGQPLGCCLQLEPVTLWVKACEVRRLASVHPCLDGRLNPCAGKVVNDPYQLQAEFFLSHRYCLELDAYFPLASAKTATPMFPSPDGAFEHPGNYSPRAWSLDEGFRVNCSPRSTKARLLKRSVSDGVSCLPPKWHPLKKRMSFDHSSAEDGAGSRSCLPVIGWESALDRSTWQDYGASTSSISPTAAGTTASVTASEGQGSLLLATATPTAHHSSEIFLCHRCRHALPASSLRKCLGRGCDNRFCSPCAAGRRGSGSLGVKGSRRSLHRWPGGEIRDATSGAAGWGDIETAERKTWGDGTSVCSESPKPWIGPCCQGQCDCQNCAAGTDEGLLSGWHARNGLSYFHLPTRRNTHQGRRLEASLPVPLIPPQPSSDRVVAMQESSWQRRKLSKALHEELQLADIQDDLVRKRDWAGKEVDGAAPAANGGGQAKSAVSDITEEMGDAIDGVVEQTGIEWCSSCRGPGPTGSLTRCYYCRAGVHASGCRWFEESLSRRRLAQHGVGQNGQLAAPPRGEGAVGHGIAVCVRDRWRAGIVLGWSPVSRAHYVRYVDGAVEQGTSVADEGLEAVPWDGEWVLLSTTADFRTVFNGKSSAVGSREPEQSNQHQRTGHVGVQASDVRWPLVDVALRLFPPRADGEQAQTRQPHAPDSKPAVKVLKVIMKHTWLASLASTKTHGNAEVTDEGTHKYRPPAVALASCLGDLECDGFGDGGASDKTRTRMRPWVCLSCIEAKLQRFQRRVRSQFQSPSKVDEQPAAAAGGEVLSPRTPGTKASSASMMGAESSSSTAAAGFKADPPVSVAGRDSKFAGWLQPQRLSKTAASEKKALAGVTTPFEANVREEERYRRPVEAERRGARADRRVRWLPIGNPGSTRPFAYEVGFVSDLSEAHANGGPTATGGGTGSGVARRGKKRLRAPPVARAIAHVMARLDSQRPLAFALPHDIIGLDGDMAAFFSTQRGASGADSAAGANGNGNEIAAGLLDDGFVVEERRAVVFVSGIAAVTVAATGAVVRGGVRGTAAVSGLMPKAVSGTALGGNDVLAGGVTGVTVQVPLAFTSVKEVDLESSARIRPLDPNKHRTLTSSSRGDGRIRSTHRMSSGDAATASVSEDASAVAGAGGDATTLKDVSKKDRLQRMDQRRMRRQGQELVDAGLLNLDVLQSRRKKLRFGRSLVHAWGVFADEPIAAGDLVIEYRGEIIGNSVADKREKMYEDMKIGSDYMFRVDEDTVVDATFKGSLARFINHSCDPSCTTRIIAVEGSKKIVTYAERDIEMGEELSYDYKFPLEPDEEARVPCRCGSAKCRGFIN